jgi:spore coat polysaccharide biosynthesis protein SpsF
MSLGRLSKWMRDSICRMLKPNRKVVAILQARTGSTRLPRKVLADVAGQPMLVLIVKRVLPAQYVDRLVIATTQLPQDDPVEALAISLGVSCFRGAEEDCLDRFYQAAEQFGADIVVRLTGDNPLVDFGFVDWMVEQYLSANPPYDYIDSTLSKTFPVGLSVEVFSFEVLATAWREDTNTQWREHVTPFIYHHPNRFRVLDLVSPQDYSHMRWTVDTSEDLAFVRRIYDHFGHDRFSWHEVLAVLDQHPEWLEINRHVQQKVV